MNSGNKIIISLIPLLLLSGKKQEWTQENYDFVKAIFARRHVPFFDKDPEAIMINAAYKGDMEILEYCIKSGVDIHAQDDSALVIAAWEGKYDAVVYLIKNGANVRADNDDAFVRIMGNTNLSSEQTIPILMALFSAMDDFSNINNKFIEKLATAARYGDDYKQIMMLLVEKDATFSPKSNVILKWAAEKGMVDIVKKQIALGADIFSDEDKIFYAAKEHYHVVEFLLDSGMTATESKLFSASTCDNGVTELLISRGATDPHCSILYNACRFGSPKSVKSLVETQPYELQHLIRGMRYARIEKTDGCAQVLQYLEQVINTKYEGCEEVAP